jgi:Zn-finger protein
MTKASDYTTDIENTRLLVKQFNEDMRQKREAMMREFRPKFSRIFTDFLRQYPEVRCIHWVQYIPYFNDGEECTFRVCDLYVVMADATNEDADWQPGADDGFDFYSLENESMKNHVRSIEDTMQADADLMRELFGAHAHVAAFKHGFVVEEYDDHD